MRVRRAPERPSELACESHYLKTERKVVMNTQLIRNVSVALLAASSMFAQEPQKLVAQIPFGFHVGNATLPAGQYTVSPADGNPLVLRVMSHDGSTNIRALAQTAETRTMPNEGKLVFTKYGD